MSRLRQFGVPAVGGGLVFALCGYLVYHFLTEPQYLGPNDFLSYWAAGRLAATGGNPYDADQLFPLQQSAGWTAGIASVHWQPPWTLAVCIPVGLLPARPAQLVWLVGQGLLVGWAAVQLWRLAGGAPGRWGVPILIALTGPGTAFLVHNGQSSGWLLVGVAGWLTAAVTCRPLWAALLALAALKPHLMVPLWVAVTADAVRYRAGFARLVALAGAVFASAAVVTLIAPDVWSQYLAATGRTESVIHRPLSAWRPPLVGYWLRTLVAPGQFWVQFVPAAVAALGTGWYVWRHPVRRWVQELPWLVCAGLAAAPYSGWPFDLVLLVAVVMPTAVALDQAGRPGICLLAAAGWLSVSAATFACIEAGLDQSVLVWVTPTVAFGVWLVDRVRTDSTDRGVL